MTLQMSLCSNASRKVCCSFLDCGVSHFHFDNVFWNYGGGVCHSLIATEEISVGTLSANGSFAVTVGKKPTAATSYLDDPAAVLELLTTMSKSTEREKRFFSSVDLSSHSLHGESNSFLSGKMAQDKLASSRGGGVAIGSPLLMPSPVPLMRGRTDGDVPRSTSASNLEIKEVLCCNVSTLMLEISISL